MLNIAHHQWANRPEDERFLSLDEMLKGLTEIRDQSRSVVTSTRRLSACPDADNKGMYVQMDNGDYVPTHWAFGQLCERAKAPAGYLRTLPSPMAADCLNFGLQFRDDSDLREVGVLVQSNGTNTLRAATGPKYGRIWNTDVVDALITSQWKVPGEFGKSVSITKENTTLYASDRDMFVFLADEKNRIEIPNRRKGQTGELARGFFVWNSEVGSQTFGVGTFLFDYVCRNRMVWGAEGYNEIRIRHTASAPDRFLEEITPALQQYSEGSGTTIQMAIADARANRLADVDEFLANRFGSKYVAPLLRKSTRSKNYARSRPDGMPSWVHQDTLGHSSTRTRG